MVGMAVCPSGVDPADPAKRERERDRERDRERATERERDREEALERAAKERTAEERRLKKNRRPCLVANRATLPQKWPPPPGTWLICMN